MPDLAPTEQEIKMWLRSTLKHAYHIEYFLQKLDLGQNDPERPHDLVGQGNKYEWDVIKGFALQYRSPKVDFSTCIKPALELHRQQYHHLKWNNPDPDDEKMPIPWATEEDMLVGAVDAVCSLLEDRSYQGGAHEYDEMWAIARKDTPHQMPWMCRIIPLMKRTEQPNLELITLVDFPELGVPKDIRDSIAARTDETIKMLRGEYGFSMDV